MGIANSCLANGAVKVYSIDYADPGDEFAAVAKRYPGKIESIKADVTKESTIEAAIEQIVSVGEGFHGMVVNAGRTNYKAALDFTEEEIHALFNINVRARSKLLYSCILNEVAVRRLLLCACCREILHQAGGQGLGRLHSIHGVVSTKQGEFLHQAW